jgi:hypothetical protein
MLRLPELGPSGPYVVVGGVGFVVLLTATVLPALHRETLRQVQRFETWHVDGPPCPSARGASGPAPPKVFEMEGVRISREHGHLACREIRDRGGRGWGRVLACQLISPGTVEVGGVWGVSRFDPGPGGPATLMIDASGVTCVTRVNHALFTGSADRPYD